MKSQTVPALALGGSVVTKLMKPLPENLSFQVTFDKLFTSLNLLQYLGSKGIGATGTFQANLRVKCPITYEKEMAKKPRGQWTIATILLTKSLSEDRMAIALSLQHPIVKQLISLGKQSDTQGRKGKSLKLISPMLLGTITKT